MTATWTLQAGSDLVYDGDPCTIVEICDGAIVTRDRTGRTRRLRMVDVLRPASEGGKAHIPGRIREQQDMPLAVIWSDATDSVKARSAERSDHIREVLTGYKSGTREAPREGEPRLEFHPSRSLSERIAAKAAELGRGKRTIARWVAQYKDAGEVGLVDCRSAQPGQSHGR
jgi:hypothetical protein